MWPFVLTFAAVALAQQWAMQGTGDHLPIQLEAVGSITHTTFSHPSFPRHSVRVKRVQDFCEKTGAKCEDSMYT